jgi:anti-anti-sigma regulatory factor
MVFVKSEFANYILSGQSSLRSLASQTVQAQDSGRESTQESIQEATQAILETTRLQWAQPLHKTTERSVEERLLDAA